MKSQKKRYYGFIALLIGVVVLFFAGLSLYKTLWLHSWVKVPIKIHRLKINTEHHGHDNHTFTIGTWYEYVYNHREYHSTDATYFNYNYSYPYYQEQLEQVLSRVPAFGFVNPNQPSKAILFQDMAPDISILFPLGITFLLWGIYLLHIVPKGIKRSSIPPEALLHTAPGQEDWKEGREKDQGEKTRQILPLFKIPIMYGFFVAFLNWLILLKIFYPTITLGLTMGVILLGFLKGWYRYRGFTFPRRVWHRQNLSHPMKGKKSKFPWGILMGFSPFIFILGFLFVPQYATLLFQSFQTQWWKKIPVQNLKIEVKTDEVRRNGEDNVPHNATVPSIETQYEYTYQHRKYHGRNFAISSDNDSFYVATGAVSEVKSRYPAFGFVNPAQPSQCVLVKGIDPEVNKAIPFLMLFLIPFGGVLLGGEKGIENPRFMFPFICTFIMAYLNIGFLQLIINPTLTFYITLGVIALAFWIGRYWSRLSTR